MVSFYTLPPAWRQWTVEIVQCNATLQWRWGIGVLQCAASLHTDVGGNGIL